MSTTEANDAASATLDTLGSAVESALHAVEELPEPQRRVALALKESIEAFHRQALKAIVTTLHQDEHGKNLLYDLVDDPAVYAVLLLHGLVRQPLEQRIREALTALRPYLLENGADASLESVEGKRVTLRFSGACTGSGETAQTLRHRFSTALRERVPDIAELVEAATRPAPSLIPLQRIQRTAQRIGWSRGPAIAEIAVDAMQALDLPDITGLLVVRLGDEVTVYRNLCAHMAMPLDDGELDIIAGTVTCPWHGFCYDARSGECLTMPMAQLESIESQVDNGYLWIKD